MDQNLDLEEQMKMLAGLDDSSLEADLGPSLNQTATATSAGQNITPYTPENPINAGIITNSITSTVEPNTIHQIPVQPQPASVTTSTTGTASVGQILQEQANNEAAAQVVHTSATNPQVVQQMNSPASTPIQTAPVQDFSIFDKEDEPVFATLGQDTNEDRLPFINLKPGEATRIIIFTLDMITVYTHFVDGLGYFRCKSKRDNGFITLKCPCCEFTDDEGKPVYAKERKILPVIEYPVSKDGKSLLAGKLPQLKFLILSKRDMQSLNTILSPEVVEDKAKLQQVLGMDFSVKIEEGDTYKTKLIASTFDTIRNQFTNLKDEVAKYNRDLLKQARDERFRDIPVESMQAALDKSRADRLAAQQIANTPSIPVSQLGI